MLPDLGQRPFGDFHFKIRSLEKRAARGASASPCKRAGAFAVTFEEVPKQFLYPP